MKKEHFEILNSFIDLFSFKSLFDSQGNEYVVFDSSKIDELDFEEYFEDKTAFEALENHVHIFDNVHKSELAYVITFSKRLGELLLYLLHCRYPKKHFVVFVTIDKSVVIRFHQKWSGEPWYYMTEDNAYDSTVLCFDC